MRENKDVNETVQGLKIKIEAIKKNTNQENSENKKSRYLNRFHKCNHSEQNTRDGRLSGLEDTLEEIDTVDN